MVYFTRYNNFQVLGIMRCNWNEVANMTGVSVTPVGVHNDYSAVWLSVACKNRSLHHLFTFINLLFTIVFMMYRNVVDFLLFITFVITVFILH